MSEYETANAYTARDYPASWGVPRGTRYSAERRDWVMRNLTSNPNFKLEQLRAGERRRLRAEVEDLDEKLKDARRVRQAARDHA